MGIALALWLDYNSVHRLKPDSLLGKWYMRLAVLALGVLIAGWVGYTRIVMGVHGIN